MVEFISKEILDNLSYKTTLGQSLKQISLSQTPLEKIIQDSKAMIQSIGNMKKQ